MAITSKTRKILWGRSGNRCAICLRELVMESHTKESESVIGEECHIVGREIDGPRGNSPLSNHDRDDVDNLLLLCRNHHKLIDDQINTFTEHILKSIKYAHEEWVRQSLSPTKINKSGLDFAFRVDTGVQLWSTIAECDGYTFDTVEPENESEAYLLGDFTQSITDYGDIWNSIESRDRILAQFDLGKQIRELNEGGFLVYAASKPQRLKSAYKKSIIDVMIGFILILRKDEPTVQRKDDEIEGIMQVKGQTQNEFSNYVPFLINATDFRIA